MTLHKAPRLNQQGASESLTGRDGLILGQSLYWFIRSQQALPENQFEWSNAEDAKLILLTHFPHVAEIFTRQDQHAGRKPADLTLEKYDVKMPALRRADNVVNINQ